MHTHFPMYIPCIFHLFHSFTAPKVHVTSWLSAAEYAAAWRHLSFMEAGVDEKLRNIKKMAISHQHEIQLVELRYISGTIQIQCTGNDWSFRRNTKDGTNRQWRG